MHMIPILLNIILLLDQDIWSFEILVAIMIYTKCLYEHQTVVTQYLFVILDVLRSFSTAWVVKAFWRRGVGAFWKNIESMQRTWFLLFSTHYFQWDLSGCYCKCVFSLLYMVQMLSMVGCFCLKFVLFTFTTLNTLAWLLYPLIFTL